MSDNVQMTTRAQRLDSELNVWFAAVRADGRPHLTPIWFVWDHERMWLCTQTTSVKAKLVRANPQVSIALENGNAPVTGEGSARLVATMDAPKSVRDAFISKYEWDVTTDNGYGVMIEITIQKWLFPGSTIVE
jgi:F420H(2)-dependent biliverdin reductase